MTRVSSFVHETEYRFEAWEDADPKIQCLAEAIRVKVCQGASNNHAQLEVYCEGIDLKQVFGLRDLWCEGSSILGSIEQSINKDSEDSGYDWWDYLPPFGVVQMYGVTLQRGSKVTNKELAAFYTLLYRSLLKYFMMVVFLESDKVCSQMVDHAGDIRDFVHDGQIGYRVKSFG